MSNILNILSHFFFALYITATAVPLVFRTEGIYPLTCIISIIMTVVCTIFRTLYRISDKQICLFIFCMIIFLVSFLTLDSPLGIDNIKNIFQFYMIAGLGSLLIVNNKYDYELFLKVLITIGVVISPIVTTTNYSSLSYEVNDEWMGTIYAITPFLVASIHYLFIGKEKKFNLLGILCVLMYGMMFIVRTPRGAVVTLLASIIIFFIQRKLNNGWSKWKVAGMGIVLFVAIILASDVLLMFFRRIAVNFDLHWLTKFVIDEDISNNRFPLYIQAIDGFLESPIWGQGLARFDNFNGYPHNLFLQMLYETGILMIIPMCYLLYCAVKIIFKRRNFFGLDYRFVTFFFLLSINQLMFSSFFWRNHCFWLLIWTVLAYIDKHKHYENFVNSQKNLF